MTAAGGTRAAARARATTISRAIPQPRDADGTRAYVGYGVDSLTVGLVAVCRVKFAGETRDAVAHLYPTAEEARITCAIVEFRRLWWFTSPVQAIRKTRGTLFPPRP